MQVTNVPPPPAQPPAPPPPSSGRTPSVYDLGTALYQLHRDVARLVDLHQRHGGLWQPGNGQTNPDLARLPLAVAEVLIAASHQEER